MFILKYALKNIIRNPFISLSSLVVIGLLVFFISTLTFTIFGTDKVIGYINGRVHIMITLQNDYDGASLRVRSMTQELLSRFSSMQVDYISRDEAFTVFQSRDPDLANLIEGVDENPLPNIIRLSNIPLDSYEGIQSTIENYKDILKYDKPMLDKKFIDFRSQYLRTSKLVQNLILLKQGVYTILVLFVFTVFIVVFMVISNTIFFLRDEISIIELVGGKSYFIYGPLMIQGMAYTGCATLLAFACFYTIPYVLPVETFSPDMRLVFTEFFDIFSGYIFPGFLASLSLGMVSAFIASWKYIHKTIA